MECGIPGKVADRGAQSVIYGVKVEMSKEDMIQYIGGPRWKGKGVLDRAGWSEASYLSYFCRRHVAVAYNMGFL